MRFSDLIVLLPGPSLDEFPTTCTGDDAQGLLTCWTSLWHPSLVANAGSMPKCQAAFDPLPSGNPLVVVPAVCQDELHEETVRTMEAEPDRIIVGLADRDEIVRRALRGSGKLPESDLAADFFALGYCFLQIELLTRQMRYASNLNEGYFAQQLAHAAEAAQTSDAHAARDHLSKCFDMLAEQRDHYYPVDAYLIDLTLMEASVLGQLRRECLQQGPINLFIGPDDLRRLQQSHQKSFAQILTAMSEDQCSVTCGPARELPSPLMACESVLRDLKAGVDQYRETMGNWPTIFARRRFGLTPFLPQVLHRLGFTGAVHATFDDGQFPSSHQSKTRWEGLDGSAVEVMARVPLDATRPESFLNLAGAISDAMESDYVATIGLAHWAGQSSLWYDDLRRCTKFTPALGKLVTLAQFFRESAHGGHVERFEADQYRSPYLVAAVAAHGTQPIGRFAHYWRRQLQASQACSLFAWSQMLGSKAESIALNELLEAVDGSIDVLQVDDPGLASLDKQLAQATRSTTAALAQSLVKTRPDGDAGVMIFNPSSCVRRVGLEIPAEIRPRVSPPIYAADRSNGRSYIVADVPPAGFVLVKDEDVDSPAQGALAEPGLLRNEFLEAHLDETTGAVRAIYDFRTRGNRASQQLAMRLPTDTQQAVYSVMCCDDMDVTVANSALGEITVRGRLVDEAEQTLANYVQRFRLWRGSRVLVNDIEMEVLRPLSGDPWKSYVASRLAWPDEASDLIRDVNMVRQKTEAQRIEAPLFVEIETAETRTTLLTGGMPFHQRIGLRKLDTLLVAKGERMNRFRLGIAIDLRHSIHEALGLLAPLPTCTLIPDASSAGSGWLFHVDARSVLITHWEHLFESNASDAAPKCLGFRIRMLESAGKSGPVTLTAYCDVATAREIDFRGEHLQDCLVEEGKVRIEMAPYQWSELECRW